MQATQAYDALEKVKVPTLFAALPLSLINHQLPPLSLQENLALKNPTALLDCIPSSYRVYYRDKV